MTTDEIRALEPNSRRRLEQFRDCFKKSPVFDYFVCYAHGHFRDCEDLLFKVRPVEAYFAPRVNGYMCHDQARRGALAQAVPARKPMGSRAISTKSTQTWQIHKPILRHCKKDCECDDADHAPEAGDEHPRL